MTSSVPTPFKFLRSHCRDLRALYEKWPVSADKTLFADILSVLVTTYSDTDPRGTLKYQPLPSSMSTKASNTGSREHEYVRHLAAELGIECLAKKEEEGKDEKEERIGSERAGDRMCEVLTCSQC